MPAMLLDNLVITDGTTTFRFLSARMMLQSWRPAVGGLRRGGTWRTPLFDAGSSLVLGEYDDITDVFELCSPMTSEDGTYARLMDLFALLEKARHYWISSYATEPVWIEAQGPDETNRRYATIKDWRMPNLGRGPFDMDWTECYVDGRSETIQLTLVHSLWQSTAPLAPECVEISAEQEADILPAEIYRPTQQSDDGYARGIIIGMDIAGQWMRMGNDAGGIDETAIRFRNVTIPQGASIVSAFVRFVANANTAGTVCNIEVAGELNATPNPFQAGGVGYADLQARVRTAARRDWLNIPGWVAGNTYDSPDISDIIEEIVALGGWASGNDMAIFFKDHPTQPSSNNVYRQPSSWDHPVDAEPELHVAYGGIEYGREATCDPECYVTNKHGEAQLTNVYHWDASLNVWSANLMLAAPPYNLLPNPVQNGDIIYFGIDSTHVMQGPFSNIVFDIGTTAVYSDLGAACNITWQYWDGGAAAWAALTVCDNTSYLAGSHPQDHPFRRAGVESVHWAQPSTWTTTVVTHPVDGAITGWWVRGLVNLGGGESIAPTPTQQNRVVYTCCWPYVDIAETDTNGETQINCDVPAVLRLDQYGKSDWYPGGLPVSWTTDRYIQRVILGLRSVDRGPDFTPYFPAGDTNQLATRAWSGIGANTAYATDARSPTGRVSRVSYPGATAALATEQWWAPWQPWQWYGRYRVYLRYVRTNGTQLAIRVRLQISMVTGSSSGAVWRSDARPLDIEPNEPLIHDFGLVTIPPGGRPSRPGATATLVGAFFIELQLQNFAAAARQIDIWDLILMPADEQLVELRATMDTETGLADSGALAYESFLAADSTTPKRTLSAERYGFAYTSFEDRWIAHNAGRLRLRPRKQQRLWWLMAQAGIATGTTPAMPYRWRPWHEQSVAVAADMIKRYLAVRGER